MCVVNIYRATNIYSGETVEGEAGDVAETLGVSDVSVRKAFKNNTYIQKAWSVEIIGTNRSGQENVYATLTDLWNSWDLVTAPFKALSEKARVKREKKEAEQKK